jgi:hypothetical protein
VVFRAPAEFAKPEIYVKSSLPDHLFNNFHRRGPVHLVLAQGVWLEKCKNTGIFRRVAGPIPIPFTFEGALSKLCLGGAFAFGGDSPPKRIDSRFHSEIFHEIDYDFSEKIGPIKVDTVV